MRTHGRPGGLIRLDTEDGARWSYTDSESGFVVILKHAADYRELGGAVDAARTRDANVARVKEEMRAARLAAAPAEEPAPVDPAAGLDMGVELITEARPVRIAGGIAESGMTEEPAPAAVRYIDATPTWAAILPALLAAVTDGTAEGQRIARAELARMARAADSAVAAAQSLKEREDDLKTARLCLQVFPVSDLRTMPTGRLRNAALDLRAELESTLSAIAAPN